MTGRGKGAERRIRRARRHARIQRTVRGTAARPRLVVSRSLRHMEGQLVDDDRGLTVLGVSTRSSAVQERLAEGAAGAADASDGDDGDDGDDGENGAEGGSGLQGKRAASFEAGRLLAERAREAGVEAVVFDRGGHPYHGRVKAFAEGARQGGLRF